MRRTKAFLLWRPEATGQHESSTTIHPPSRAASTLAVSAPFSQRAVPQRCTAAFLVLTIEKQNPIKKSLLPASGAVPTLTFKTARPRRLQEPSTNPREPAQRRRLCPTALPSSLTILTLRRHDQTQNLLANIPGILMVPTSPASRVFPTPPLDPCTVNHGVNQQLHHGTSSTTVRGTAMLDGLRTVTTHDVQINAAVQQVEQFIHSNPPTASGRGP